MGELFTVGLDPSYSRVDSDGDPDWGLVLFWEFFEDLVLDLLGPTGWRFGFAADFLGDLFAAP